MMLRIGLIGESAPSARTRLAALNTDGTIAVDDMRAQPHLLPTCHLVAGFGLPDRTADAAADVWLDNTDALDAFWRDRVVPFARNLATGVRAPRRRHAVLVGPDPTWPVQAQRLIARLQSAVGKRVHRIDHIGSTSVPGLAAKDLVDIQIVVADLDVAANVADAAADAGFVRVAGPLWCVDRFGMRHYEEVVVDADPGRPVNVNIRPITAPIWRETLLFRDWLRAEPAARDAYEAMKRELSARPDSNVDEYSVDKYPWISDATGRAEAWAARVGHTRERHLTVTVLGDTRLARSRPLQSRRGARADRNSGHVDARVLDDVERHCVRLKVGPNSTSLSLTEGDSHLVTFLLDAPIIANTPNPDVTVNFTVDDPTRVTLSTDSLVWSASEWAQARNLTVNALDDGVHNDTNTVVVHYTATSGSPYYNNFSGSLTVTLTDVDPAPTTTTTAATTTTTVTTTTTTIAPTSTSVAVAPSTATPTTSTPAVLPTTGSNSSAPVVGALLVICGSSALALSSRRRRRRT